ncbi:MFS transporter [Rhodococcus zopfii]|uniref:MFS transporter n=1 Tax=Rhodococcus zopfii TaxID=43772 RepID=UPI000932BD8D|nr:MFS transporter [Rhodococcus zopfii]
MERPGAVRTRLLLPALCLVVTTVAVMQTVVVPIVGTIRDQLDVSTTASGWLLTANLLAAAVATPVLGRLADLRGKRAVLVGILCVVLAGSLLCAVTDSFALLVAGRVLQGASFALFPVGIAVLREEMEPDRLVGAMGLLSGTMGVGGAVGMVLTGATVSGDTDYRRVFWLVVVFNIVGLVLALVVVPKRAAAAHGRIDWAGAVLLSIGLALALLALSEGGTWGWGSPATLLCAAGGLAVLAGWFAFELRVDEPLVPPRMLTHRPVLVLHLAALLVGVAMFVNFLATSYFVQTPSAAGYGFGSTVLEATAVYMLPGALVGVAAAALAGRLVHRFTAKRVLGVSCVIGTAGFVLIAVLHDRSWHIIVSGILVSIFVSLAYAALPALLVAEVRADETGVANSINSIARTVGSSLSSALVTTLLATQVTAGGFVKQTAYVAAFGLAAVAATVAAFLVFATVRTPTRTLTDAEEDEVDATALAAEWAAVGGLAGGRTATVGRADLAGTAELPKREFPV